MTQRNPSPSLRPAALWVALALAGWALLLGLPGWDRASGEHGSSAGWEARSPVQALRLPTQTLVARQSQGGGSLLPRGASAPLLVAEPSVPLHAFRLARRAIPAVLSLPHRFTSTAWPRGPPLPS